MAFQSSLRDSEYSFSNCPSDKSPGYFQAPLTGLNSCKAPPSSFHKVSKMQRFSFSFCIILLIVFSLSGCKNTTSPTAEDQSSAADQQSQGQAASASPSPTPSAQPRPSGPIEFTDVTAEAKIRFKHNSGAFGKKYLPETIGAGCAFIDYDSDGWQDILLVNSTDWPENKRAKSY